jgi:hypothetical protein
MEGACGTLDLGYGCAEGYNHQEDKCLALIMTILSVNRYVHIQEHSGIYRMWKRAKFLMGETVHVYPGVVE